MLSLAASGQVRSSCGGAGSRAAAAVPSAGDGLCRRTPWPGTSTGRGRCCLQRWARTCSPLFAASIPLHRPFLMGRRGHRPRCGGLFCLKRSSFGEGSSTAVPNHSLSSGAGGARIHAALGAAPDPQPDPGSVAPHRPGSVEARCPPQAREASWSPPSRSPPCTGDPRFSQLPACSRRNPQALLLLYYLQAGSPLPRAPPSRGLPEARGRVWRGKVTAQGRAVLGHEPRIPCSEAGECPAADIERWKDFKKYMLKQRQRFSSPNPRRQTSPSAGELWL